jgi:hypothetical protein
VSVVAQHKPCRSGSSGATSTVSVPVRQLRVSGDVGAGSTSRVTETVRQSVTQGGGRFSPVCSSGAELRSVPPGSPRATAARGADAELGELTRSGRPKPEPVGLDFQAGQLPSLTPDQRTAAGHGNG